MTKPDDPEFARQLGDAEVRLRALHVELCDACPALRGNLSIPGMLVGHGLGVFVANGMRDDEIVTHVLTIVAQIRQSLGQSEARDDDAIVH